MTPPRHPAILVSASRTELSGSRTRRQVMSNSERELFELAQVYRAVYALRSAYDRQPVLRVSAAIAYGKELMGADSLSRADQPTPSR
jgi:hypothetical protein